MWTKRTDRLFWGVCEKGNKLILSLCKDLIICNLWGVFEWRNLSSSLGMCQQTKLLSLKYMTTQIDHYSWGKCESTIWSSSSSFIWMRYTEHPVWGVCENTKWVVILEVHANHAKWTSSVRCSSDWRNVSVRSVAQSIMTFFGRWVYLFFIVHLLRKQVDEHTGFESYVFDRWDAPSYRGLQHSQQKICQPAVELCETGKNTWTNENCWRTVEVHKTGFDSNLTILRWHPFTVFSERRIPKLEITAGLKYVDVEFWCSRCQM